MSEIYKEKFTNDWISALNGLPPPILIIKSSGLMNNGIKILVRRNVKKVIRKAIKVIFLFRPPVII